MVVRIEGLKSLTARAAHAVAFDAERFLLCEETLQAIDEARAAYDEHIIDGYAYGHNTAPGNRAKVTLNDHDIVRASLSEYLVTRSGATSGELPPRVVRLALLLRLTNALAGVGKITAATAQAIVDAQSADITVPLFGLHTSGEVVACGWLLAPISDKPLLAGEAMALVNGSPFASAFSFDVARTSRRRFTMARQFLAYTFECSDAPLTHVDPALGAGWPVPSYQRALSSLSGLLDGGKRGRLSYQAPTCFRVVPNILAAIDDAIAAMEKVAKVNLTAVKDNPTLVRRPGGKLAILSAAGYHDNFSAKAIDQVNAVLCDLVVLACKQIAHFVAGVTLQRPLYYGQGGPAGIEYLAWTCNDLLASAQEAARPTSLFFGDDPGGNQSDIPAPAFRSYSQYLKMSEATDKAMSVLLVSAALSVETSSPGNGFSRTFPPALVQTHHWLVEKLSDCIASGKPALATAEPLRAVIEEVSALSVYREVPGLSVACSADDDFACLS